jgi:hypothetical protein
MHQPVPNHLILPLEPLSALASRAAFDWAVVGSIGRVDIGVGIQEVLVQISRDNPSAERTTNLRLKWLGATAKICTLEAAYLRVRNAVNAHAVNGQDRC